MTSDPTPDRHREAREPVTSETAETLGTFSEHRKTATTRISDFTVPPGTPFQTPEGLRAEDEDTRVAFDVQGGVYPIRESVFRASYALAALPDSGERAGLTGYEREAWEAVAARLDENAELPPRPTQYRRGWAEAHKHAAAAIRAALATPTRDAQPAPAGPEEPRYHARITDSMHHQHRRTSDTGAEERLRAALREAIKADLTALAHWSTEDWQERGRGADPIARTINAARDIVDARFDEHDRG